MRVLLRRSVTLSMVAAALSAISSMPLGRVAEAAGTLPPAYAETVVTDSVTRPVDMAFAPDGRLFVAEQDGRIRIVRQDGTLATFLNISTKVDATGERGLLAIAFDPGFDSNGYVYAYYTRKATSTLPVHNRVVRVTASGDRAVAGSERLILRLDAQTTTEHMGGSLAFGADGKLYITTSDGGVPQRSRSLGNLFGKILRINKNGTIPSTNPYHRTATGKNRDLGARPARSVQDGRRTWDRHDV